MVDNRAPMGARKPTTYSIIAYFIINSPNLIGVQGVFGVFGRPKRKKYRIAEKTDKIEKIKNDNKFFE